MNEEVRACVPEGFLLRYFSARIRAPCVCCVLHKMVIADVCQVGSDQEPPEFTECVRLFGSFVFDFRLALTAI